MIDTYRFGGPGWALALLLASVALTGSGGGPLESGQCVDRHGRRWPDSGVTASLTPSTLSPLRGAAPCQQDAVAAKGGMRMNKFTFRALTMMLEPTTLRSHLFVHFVALVVLASAPVRAQVPHQHKLSDQVDRSSVASAASFDEMMHEAMTRMDSGMSIRHSGDPDRDFAAMMIPHHQGAIDMAKAELQFGRDPVLRRLAQGIIVEQQQEIELMRRQLQRLSPPPQRKEK